MSQFGTLVEEVRPWFNSAGIVAVLTLVARIWFTSRKIRMTEAKDDRDGYGVLISTLEKSIASMEERHKAEMQSLREDHTRALARMEADHRTCQERLSKIEGELMGFHRQALVASQSGIAILPASPMVRDASERAIEAATDKLNKQP